jgi:hypothetical protein
MNSFWRNTGQISFGALAVSMLIWAISSVNAAGHDGNGRFAAQNVTDRQPQPQGAFSPTPSPTASPTATPSNTPPPQIDGVGTIASPAGRRDAQFFIFDVENEQVTPEFLEGEFGYLDKKAHINFTTGRIQTVTINGNQAAFTGMARIGGKHRETIQFTVTVTANQTPGINDTFSIVLSNGYANSGNLTSGQILIRTLDPD